MHFRQIYRESRCTCILGLEKCHPLSSLLRPDIQHVLVEHGAESGEQHHHEHPAPLVCSSAHSTTSHQPKVYYRRGITPDTAWLLAAAFGTTPEFWMNLESTYDLARERPETKIKLIRAAGGRR